MFTTTGTGSGEGSPFSLVEPEAVTGEELHEEDGEEVNSDDDEQARSNTDNMDTDGSFVGSGGAFANRMDPASYVDLTGGGFCGVVITHKTLKGSKVPCVCGNPSVTCRRRGHKGKQGNTTPRGLPCYYPALPGRTVNATIDGRMSFTIERSNVVEDIIGVLVASSSS
jgi:hypothetical protein